MDLLISVMDSPYSNYLTRQFVVAAVTKISSRYTTSSIQQTHISDILANYTTSPELELQQRAVEFASLFALGELRVGVLERMPPPEIKATVMGVGEFCWCCLNQFRACLYLVQLARTSLWDQRRTRK